MSVQEEQVVECLLKKKSSISTNIVGVDVPLVPEIKPVARKKRKASAANPLSSMKASNDSNSFKKKKISKFKRS